MNLRDLILWAFVHEKPAERIVRSERVDAAHAQSEEVRRRIENLAAEARSYEGLDRR